MRPIGSSKTARGPRRSWQPPAVKKLAIGTETKLGRESGRSAGSEASGAGQARFAHPQPPAAPSTKLGFSFEMSFPLSARTES
jgi:hypothetical protein